MDLLTGQNNHLAIVVIGVDSVEALMAVVQEAGGTEVMPVM